jgi:hypothetical protein
MSRLIAELDAALEQRAGAAHAPSLSHPKGFLAASEVFCDG